MLIHLKCPFCGKQLKVSEKYAGKTGTCPGCSKHVQIPAAQSPAHAPHHDSLTVEEVHGHEGHSTGESHKQSAASPTRRARRPTSAGFSWAQAAFGIFVILGILKSCGFIGLPMFTSRVEQSMLAELQKAAEQNKQAIFRSIHPVGTAKNIVIHDLTVTAWKNGRATNRYEDIRQFTTRYTIYWEGPIVKDGYTEVTQTFDTEVKRYVACKILATNGITNADAGDAALNFLGGFIEGYLEQAARN